MSLHGTPEGDICAGDMVVVPGKTYCTTVTNTTAKQPIPHGTPVYEVLQCVVCGATAYGRMLGTYPLDAHHGQ